MFGFNTLELDTNVLIYEGTRHEVDQILGSSDAAMRSKLKLAGKKYRSGKDRDAFNLVVDQLLDTGKSRSPIRYEVLAQLYRVLYSPIYKGEPDIYLDHETMSKFIEGYYKWIHEWRDYWTEETTKTMSYDSYVTTSFITNQELQRLFEYIAANQPATATELTLLNDQLPALERIYKNGNDALIVNGGYVPKKLNLKSW